VVLKGFAWNARNTFEELYPYNLDSVSTVARIDDKECTLWPSILWDSEVVRGEFGTSLEQWIWVL
jgi:hypothetical protein